MVNMRVLLIFFGIIQFFDIFTLSTAWDNDELEVFDVVEEVNQNFYDLLGVSEVKHISFTCPTID